MPAKLLILIPCHSMEDFPTELGEKEAAGLLNAFAVAFHPRLLASIEKLPTWQRADTPEEPAESTWILIPECCDTWLPHGWRDAASQSGATLITATPDRAALIAEIESLLDASHAESAADPAASPALDPNVLADFLAFGSAFLQVELLTRRMHFYSNLDDGTLREAIVSAAKAATTGEADDCRQGLRRAFELLLDARERYYPIEAFLIDVCLVIPRLAGDLPKTLTGDHPTTLLATAAEWEEIAANQPELISHIRDNWPAHRVGLIGGEYHELPSAILPTETLLEQFTRGLETYQKLFDRTPLVWARRRFGMTAFIPQSLDRAQLPFALHVALDDGIYPDDEASKLRWEGADGTGVDAFSRIPLAADSATSFLRFSQRMAESMEEDIAAAVMFARWPEMHGPWFEDFRRIHAYGPILGRFVTLERFFQDTEPPGRVFPHKSTDYFAPYVSQTVARQLPDPISQFSRVFNTQRRADNIAWLLSVTELLGGSGTELAAVRSQADSDAERALRPFAGGDPPAVPATENAASSAQSLGSLQNQSAQMLAECLLAGGGNEPGLLLLNPLSFTRRVTIGWPVDWHPPAVESPIRSIQFDDHRREVTLDLPAAGFQWLPRPQTSPTPDSKQPATVAEGALRNEFFEVHISEKTGGIAYVKGYGRVPKRISQQLAFRFPRKRDLGQQGYLASEESYYSQMRCNEITVTCDGPGLGEIVSTGQIIDQTNGQPLADFRQTTRVRRGQPNIEIDIELNPHLEPTGDPWTNYFACRFAWNDETAVLTRDLHERAQPVPQGRFDAPHFIEIAEGELRTTIIPLDTPFHRRTGERMLDSLLIVAGETRRHFRFVIAGDEAYPLRAALDAQQSAIALETTTGPPAASSVGWFFHLDSKNVQIVHVDTLSTPEARTTLALRLLETEGRGRVARLTCFRTPRAARIINLRGETMADLSINNDSVLVDLHPFEVATLQLEF